MRRAVLKPGVEIERKGRVIVTTFRVPPGDSGRDLCTEHRNECETEAKAVAAFDELVRRAKEKP